MDFVLEKASIPFTIDALVILCFKSLGVWAADEITIAGHLQVLFPSMTFDVRIPCHGYTLLRNVSSHNGHACYVPNFLIEQVRVVFRRNPTIFSLPRGLESTKESLPHCIVWSAIQPNSTVLAKVRDSSNLLSNSFVESLSDILFSDINFFGMNADQIRKLLIKSENTFEIQKFLAEKHFSSPLITVNSPLPLTTAPLYSRASFWAHLAPTVYKCKINSHVKRTYLNLFMQFKEISSWNEKINTTIFDFFLLGRR